MKKRLIACLLALSILTVGLIFTSCAKKVTAAELIETAFEANDDLKSYNADIVFSAKGDNEFKEIDYSRTTEIFVNGDTMYVKDGLTASAKKNEYYTDGTTNYTYIGSMGRKQTVTDDNKLTFADELEDLFVEPADELLAEIEIVENEETGVKTVTVNVPDEKFVEMFGKAFGEDFNTASGLPTASAEGASLKDGKIEITVNAGGYVSSYKVSCKTSRTWIGNELVYDLSAEITFKAPGADITVPTINGQDKFIEIK